MRTSPQVSTVDGFQGREVDVVLFSCVRAPSDAANDGRYGGGIGFLADRRRMNVAITRARRSLIVLGNARRLSSDATWEALVDHASSRDRLVPEVRGCCGDRGAGGGGGGAERGEMLCARLEAISEAAAAAEALPPDEHGESVQPSGKCKGALATDRDGGGYDCNRDGGEQAGPAGEGDPALASSWDNAAMGPREFSLNRACAAARRDEELERGGRSGGQELDTVSRKKKRSLSHDTSNDASQLDIRRDSSGVKPLLARGKDDKPAAAQAATETSRPGGRNRRDGGVHPPPKRARVIPRPLTRCVEGSSTNNAPRNCPADGTEKGTTPAQGGIGFLGDLLGSLHSHAEGIASGKEHEFRQGLRGGEVSLEGGRSRKVGCAEGSEGRCLAVGWRCPRDTDYFFWFLRFFTSRC